MTQTIETHKGTYTWDEDNNLIDTPDGISLVFEDFLTGPVDETVENFRELVERYEASIDLEISLSGIHCQWFARCSNLADTTRRGPTPLGEEMWGQVPICNRCNERLKGLE